MKPNQKRYNFLHFTFLPVSFLGFLDASYLSVKHFVGTPPPCSVLRGCEEVTTSQYSVIGGIPVALLGAIYYLAIFILILSVLKKRNMFSSSGAENVAGANEDKLLNFTACLTVIGLLASLWFIYLQLFVIKAICLYCMFSALTSTALFVFGVLVLKFKPKIIS
ncbi:MAG: Vitamin epoxide reductase family protein [Parcubacteria group bacterium]|nr:Vitamin epoxide reductase family protein [Parcubacteria group bacterium]